MAIQEIYDAVMAYDDEGVAELVNAEVAAGTDVTAILNQGMIAALDEIGDWTAPLLNPDPYPDDFFNQ